MECYVFSGATDASRTHDLILTKDALYLLSYSSICTAYTGGGVFMWQGQKDLNPRHAVLETAALPAELYPSITNLVGLQGLEPRTNRL